MPVDWLPEEGSGDPVPLSGMAPAYAGEIEPASE